MAKEEESKKETLGDEVKDISLDYKKEKVPGEISEKAKEEMEKTRKELENLKKKILKNYPFTVGIGILPPQAAEKIEEEENVPPEEAKKKPIHIIVIVPEDKFKEINKIKLDLIKESKDMKPKVWIHVKTPVDIFNYCLDGKYDIGSAIAMAFPLHDKGLLGALRVAEIHKSLVLRKFERYVVSYVIGGSLVRGDATKDSDVDVFVIIDDTDVKRMPRLELKEKLRGIIYSYVMEASEIAGVKNKLEPQIYLFTDFWESVKDAHPVMFTFIRDGIPLYDKGTFMPWKMLLKMGKLKPSPEAIDMFMSMSDKVVERVKRDLLDTVIGDIYWGAITPAQALIMLYGLPPPTHKEILQGAFRKVFVDKEKILEKKYADILERIIQTYKDYEHGKVKEVKGADVDKYLEDFQILVKRLKELREQIEKVSQEKTIDDIYNNIFNMLKQIFGKKSESILVSEFERNFIKGGKLPENYLKILKDLIKAKKDFKKGKLDKHEVDNVRKNATILVNHLIEYNQRCDLVAMQKGKMRLKTKDKTYELVLTEKIAFLIDEGEIRKINIESGKIENSSAKEMADSLEQQRDKREVVFNEKLFEILRKEIGSFEIIL